MTSTTGPVRVTEHDAKKVAFGAFVGTALEWYDYFLFGTAASIVFNQIFFVGSSDLVSTMAAFAAFAVGFVARPVGAVLFGHLGDRIGRKKCLIITVTMIGVVTGLIGLLPAHASIGVAAPVILTVLRMLQGIAVGGEWGGAVTLAVEHAPQEHRGRYAALPQLGSPIGTILSSGGFALVQLLPEDDFMSWGWRIPFLVAIPLLVIAIYLRRRVEESPLFEQLLEQDERASLPAWDVVTKAPLAFLVGAGSTLLGVGGFYLVTSFMISYGTGELGISTNVMLVATMVAAAFEVGILLVFGRVVERIGAARVTVIGGLASAVLSFPVFWMVDTTNTIAVVLGVTIGVGALSIPYAASGALLTQLFLPRLRYSGVAISSNTAGVVSGFIPLSATALLGISDGQSWSPALLLILLALVTAACGAMSTAFAVEDDVEKVA